MSRGFETDTGTAAESQMLRERIAELEGEVAQLQRRLAAGADRETLYHSIVDNQSEMICRINRSLELTYVNRAFREFFEKSRDELLGQRYVDCLAPSMREMAQCLLDGLFEQPQVTMHVCEMTRGSGRLGWQHCVISPIFGANNDVIALQIVARLRSTRHQAEYEIKNAEIINGQLAKIMKDGLIVVDAAGTITSVNDQLCKIAGNAQSDLVGNSMWNVVGEENREYLGEQFAKRRLGSTSKYELTWNNNAGRTITAIFSPTPLFDHDGSFDGSLSVVTDITERREMENQLRESERLLAASQRIARFGSFEWKWHGNEVIWSEELFRIFGQTPEAFTPSRDTFLECVHPDDRESVISRIDNVMSGKEDEIQQYRIVRPDGQIRWVESTRWLVTDKHANPSGMIGTTRDITEQKLAELALDEQESIVRSFYESGVMMMGVVEINDDGLRWISENEATARYLETSTGVLTNKQVNDTPMNPEAVALWMSKYREAEQTGAPVRFEYQREHHRDKRWVEATVSLIGHSPQGYPRFSYICDDVTDRKRVEEKIRAAYDELEQRVEERTAELVEANHLLQYHAQLLDSVRESVVATDLEGNIVYWGKGAEKLYGYASSDAVGRPIAQITRSDGSQSERERMAQVRESGSWHGELRQLGRDGSYFWTETFVSLVNDSQGQPTGFIAIDRDITARRQAEEQMRQLHADLAHVLRLGTMGEMASGLAHEINQPLGTIANNANAVLRGMRNHALPQEETIEIIEEIRGEAMRAGEILRSLHRFTSRAEPDRAAVDFGDLVREVLRLFESESRRFGVTITLGIDENLPLVQVDRIQVQQVVVNLIRNAFDALIEARYGLREITIRATAKSDEVVVSIIDTAKKLPPELFDNMFSPYFTTKQDGMGMGLSICRSIISAHGSQLWATQNADRGLTFHFTLPIH